MCATLTLLLAVLAAQKGPAHNVTVAGPTGQAECGGGF